jgi:mannose-6-phosphate isomerase-like protein (cupin superfamily)
VTDSIPSKVWALIVATRKTLAGRASWQDPIGREVLRVLPLLDEVPEVVSGFHRSEHPILAHADAALGGRRALNAPLTRELRPTIDWLPWEYSYAERPDTPGLGRRIAFAELVGPAAPIPSRDFCLGFTLIAPDTLYPAHHHPATELYYVIVGNAIWSLENVERNNPPGTFILHPSLARHAMRTGDEVLLALYTWSGPDVRTSSAYSEP